MGDSANEYSNRIAHLTNELKEYAKDISIIYAEDDSSISQEVETFLRKFFKNIRTFNNGEKAYLSYLEVVCDILITDIVMPHMNGFELLKLVKKVSPNQKTVVISAHDESNYMVQLINMEIDGFLEKPISNEEFLKILHMLCKTIHNERKITQQHH